jgi:hypothetical protein
MNTITKLANYCRHASEVFIAHETKQKYVSLGVHMLNAAPIKPALPTTRDAATPHILLAGPFQDEPGLVAVGVYVGIGFIEVRDLKNSIRHHQLNPLDGNDLEARRAYLVAALHLYFDVKKIEAPAS